MGSLREAERNPYKRIWVAGKTVAHIHSIEPVETIMKELKKGIPRKL